MPTSVVRVSDGTGETCQSYLLTTYGGLWTCSSTTGRQQVGWHYGCQLTHGQDADPTTIRAGSVDMGDHDIPGSVRWRSMLESLLMMHGTLQPIAVYNIRPSYGSNDVDDAVI